MRDRRVTVALTGSAVITLAVAAVVLLFGVRTPPSFPDPPADVPGRIAYLRVAGNDAPCVHVVEASGGEPHELRCFGGASRIRWAHALAWTPGGDLIVVGATEIGGDAAILLDGATGDVLESTDIGDAGSPRPGPLPDGLDPRERPDGSGVTVATTDRHATVAIVPTAGEPRRIVELEVDGGYGFVDAVWSPDGAWLLVTDTEQRLLVVAADGGGPYLLVDAGASGPAGDATAWHQPGEDTYTVTFGEVTGAAGP